jgi:hypothetical protein
LKEGIADNSSSVVELDSRPSKELSCGRNTNTNQDKIGLNLSAVVKNNRSCFLAIALDFLYSSLSMELDAILLMFSSQSFANLESKLSLEWNFIKSNNMDFHVILILQLQG